LGAGGRDFRTALFFGGLGLSGFHQEKEVLRIAVTKKHSPNRPRSLRTKDLILRCFINL
jgi:hypothetical protein